MAGEMKERLNKFQLYTKLVGIFSVTVSSILIILVLYVGVNFFTYMHGYMGLVVQDDKQQPKIYQFGIGTMGFVLVSMIGHILLSGLNLGFSLRMIFGTNGILDTLDRCDAWRKIHMCFFIINCFPLVFGTIFGWSSYWYIPIVIVSTMLIIKVEFWAVNGFMDELELLRLVRKSASKSKSMAYTPLDNDNGKSEDKPSITLTSLKNIKFNDNHSPTTKSKSTFTAETARQVAIAIAKANRNQGIISPFDFA